ncbi:TlpA family protein disulfide reductase [bacterium]|nr:MAG: TlpA family protein disulfide reductase [bacterium]
MKRGRFLMGLAAGTALVPELDGRAVASRLAGDHARASFSRGAIAPGHPMPAMTAPLVDGQEFSLASLRGHPLWINCFATWCQPCNEEMPTIVSIARRNAGRGLRVLGISMSEDAAVIPPFVKRYAIPFPVVLDHEQATKTWGITDIPTSIFLDAHGIVREVHLGELDAAGASRAVAAVLAKSKRG